MSCAVCGNSAALRCAACHRTRYCGELCQRAHWASHRPACELATLSTSDLLAELGARDPELRHQVARIQAAAKEQQWRAAGRPGWEHFGAFGAGLSQKDLELWPFARAQMHAGGWSDSLKWVSELQLQQREHLLDLCCGEGGTAVWLASEAGRRVTGVDIAPTSLEVARRVAETAGVSHLVEFVEANVFELPFPADTFDAVLAQDADAINHPHRAEIFKEVFRVIKQGSFFGLQHHSVAGPDFPEEVLEHIGEDV
eukprot:TRINITY_DN2530_c0_g1_i4.p1 TRINITY_DN2530_c0_g1~~TRINITY_DN2530_c0_g1_i4.p1  ORF type:complete len:255 (-),score=52.36 TRINITY_DN2530_c0_g1_i4:326-1090(-)